jgi:polyhydroxyalkanoate synthesis regulator phasin
MATENNPLIQVLQQSFRITIGVTTSLVETLQNPEKRSETLTELQNQWNQKSQEWSAKGETTEQEARRLVEEWLNRQRNSQTPPTDDSAIATPAESSPPNNVQSQIQDLTQQLTALRAEIERLRESNNP